MLAVWCAAGSAAVGGDVTVRHAAVAGSFYPAQASALKAEVDRRLAAAHPTAPAGRIVALMAPHAGYEFSGGIAATSYKAIAGGDWRRIILVGPSHFVAFEGFAVDDSTAWETPLGQVPVDQETVKALLARDPRFRVYPPAHEREHALETQLPFLQETLKDFRIVPIIVGSHEAEAARVLADAFVDLLRDPHTLLVVSCDLSHYYAYDRAVAMDGAALLPISQLDIEGFIRALGNHAAEIDAPGPVLAMMLTARRLGASSIALLAYANSGDVTGEKSRVVGYGALAASVPQASTLTTLDAATRASLLGLARRSIREYLDVGQVTPAASADARVQERRGVFVTIMKDGQLRGCIGTIEPVSTILEAVQQSAISAATHDPRFPSMRLDEVPRALLEISILSAMEPVGQVEEIQVGTHGLYLVHGEQSGLLLPQVAPEQGWDRAAFLEGLCRKAGLPPEAWRDPGARLYRFTVEHFSEPAPVRAP